MLFAVVLVVVLVVMLVVIYIYVNDYKNDYKSNYKLQCIIPSQYLYVNNYKHDYKPNYKLQCIFSSQYRHEMRKPMMFSITIPTCNCKTSWVPMMLCQRWYNIMGGLPHRVVLPPAHIFACSEPKLHVWCYTCLFYQ